MTAITEKMVEAGDVAACREDGMFHDIFSEQDRHDIVRACLTAALATEVDQPFQARVDTWLLACFGETIARDKIERNHRFIEEALELVQANGCTASEAHQLVDYVYGRPVGDLHQEVGGVMNTLAALCLASGVDLNEAAETELARVWTKVEKIRAKQAAKPKHSPLPEAATEVAGEPEPVAWQWLSGSWHTVDATEFNDAEQYAKSFGLPVRAVYAAPPKPAAVPTRDEIAVAIHKARFVSREPTPFGEDRLDTKYSYRLADAILALLTNPQVK